MVFSSLEDCIAFIKSAQSSIMSQLAEEIKRVMDEVTREQVQGWSGQIFSSVIPSSNLDSAEASFEDNGHWISLVGKTEGQEVGNPIKFLEAGSTWNRGASNIMDTSHSRAENEIPQKYKSLMNGVGVPVR